jgi:hypothetical protein
LLIVVLVILVFAIVVIELGNYSTLNYSPSVSGSVTVGDEVGDTSSETSTDILEVTAERNETDFKITVKVGGNLSNFTYMPDGGYSFGCPTSGGYPFNDVVRLDFEHGEWVPKLGHIVQSSALHMDYWFVECAGEDFPGSLTLTRDTVTINLDSKFLREDMKCRAFDWFVRSGTSLPQQSGEIIGSGITWDTTKTSYFPDYESFLRQGEQSSTRQSLNFLYLTISVSFLILAGLYLGYNQRKKGKKETQSGPNPGKNII